MEQLDKNYWDSRYKTEQTGWDLGTVSGPLQSYIDQLDNKDLRILIPGCGNAYEAEYLLHKGFTKVTLIDISPSLVNDLRKRFENHSQITVLEGDFFEHDAVYDLILEQTFMCALDPALREAYTKKMHSLLADNGKIAGLLFGVEFEKAGPPFGGNADAYQKQFAPYFNIKTMEKAHNSAKPREGNELFIILIKQ